MVMGSRIGASFVVLAIGFFYDLRAGQLRGGVYVGALALLTTATVYLPAWGLGYAMISNGAMDGLQVSGGGEFFSIISSAINPAVGLLQSYLPPWGMALSGIGILLLSFKLFDKALPAVDPTGGKLGRMATTIFRPPIAFLFGMLLTAITLSVSVSLTLLVPLTVRGIVRRENLIPFILGANITTFVDTLFASLLISHEGAFRVVACAVLVVTSISAPIVFAFYGPYERTLDVLASWFTHSKRRLALFVALLFLIPLLLMLPSYL